MQASFPMSTLTYFFKIFFYSSKQEELKSSYGHII